MISTGNLSVVDLLRKRVADLSRELAERDSVLHERTRHLRVAQSLAHLGSWDWDIDRGEVRCSNELYRIFGREPDVHHITFEIFLSTLLPEDHDRVVASINGALRGTVPYDVEYRIVRPNGEVRTIHCCGEVLRDDHGKPHRMSGSVLDITERTRTEAMLRSSQEKLRQALHASGIGLWDWNTDTNELVLSEEWKRQLGYEETELTDSFETWEGLLHADDHDRAIAYVRGYVRDPQGEYRQEFRLRHKDGTYRWIEARASFVTDADGRRVRLLGSHTNITDRKRMEEAVRESEDRYRTLVELSPSAVFVFCEGRTVYANHTGAILMGANDPKEIMERSMFDCIHSDYHDEVRVNVKRLLTGRVSVHSAERIYLKKDGTPVPVQVEAARIMWNGTPAILGLVSDITDRKQAEEALRASEELFSKAFRFSPDPMMLMELDSGRWLDVNDACLVDFGYAREDVVGQRRDELEHWLRPDDQVRFIERLHREGSIRNFEAVVETARGEPRDCLVSAERIEYRGRSCMITLCKDITERRQAEQALWKSQQAIRALLDISSAQGQSFKERVEALLHLGCRFFDLSIGMETLVRGEELEVGQVVPGTAAYHPGMSVFLRNTYCRETLRQRRTLSVEHAGASPEWRQHPAYAALKMESYIGTEIKGVERTYGTLCFAGVEPREKRFTDSERDVIQLMARWLGGELDRHTALDGLRKSEERYRTLYDETPSTYFTVDETGIIRSINQYGAQYLGYRVEDLVGKSVTAIIHEGDRERIRAEMEAFVRHPEGIAQWEFRKVRCDGAVLWVREFARVLRSPSGESVALIVCDDITERKHAEDKLGRSHTFLRQVIDTDPNFIFAKDRQGRFTMVNQAVADCYGTTVEGLIGKSDADFNAHADEVECFRQNDLEVINSGRDRFIPEERITDGGGRTRWLQTVKRPLFDDQGQVQMVLGAATDITERKRMEEILVQREQDLSAALLERERISQDLHDGILQSLYVVGLGLEGCKPLIKQQPEHVAEEFMTTLDQAIGQLSQVMGEIRNFIAGLESHLVQGGDFPTALRTMVLNMCSSSAADCRVRIDDAAGPHISTEQALHIINIVREGLSNSLRHSHATRIIVSLRPLLGSVRLVITDNGVGFNPTSAHGTGRGLGNMAARAQKVGGLFAIRSELGKGTRILLDFPKDMKIAPN
jgi:PAS domain S-box-containing protein